MAVVRSGERAPSRKVGRRIAVSHVIPRSVTANSLQNAAQGWPAGQKDLEHGVSFRALIVISRQIRPGFGRSVGVRHARPINTAQFTLLPAQV
jgi:hypothetical protein